MKLVIELSENDYKALKEDGVQNHIALADTIIACSVPYEERSQGDFISRDYLKQMIPAPIEDEYKYVHQIIDNAPAVELSEEAEDYTSIVCGECVLGDCNNCEDLRGDTE